MSDILRGISHLIFPDLSPHLGDGDDNLVPDFEHTVPKNKRKKGRVFSFGKDGQRALYDDRDVNLEEGVPLRKLLTRTPDDPQLPPLSEDPRNPPSSSTPTNPPSSSTPTNPPSSSTPNPPPPIIELPDENEHKDNKHNDPPEPPNDPSDDPPDNNNIPSNNIPNMSNNNNVDMSKLVKASETSFMKNNMAKNINPINQFVKKKRFKFLPPTKTQSNLLLVQTSANNFVAEVQRTTPIIPFNLLELQQQYYDTHNAEGEKVAKDSVNRVRFHLPDVPEQKEQKEQEPSQVEVSAPNPGQIELLLNS